MNTFLIALVSVGLIAVIFLIFAMAVGQHKKSKVVSSVSVQCSTGDQEVLTLNHNFLEGESDLSKATKIREAYDFVDKRRDETHRKMVEIRQRAREENETKNPEDLKLRSVMEAERT